MLLYFKTTPPTAVDARGRSPKSTGCLPSRPSAGRTGLRRRQPAAAQPAAAPPASQRGQHSVCEQRHGPSKLDAAQRNRGAAQEQQLQNFAAPAWQIKSSFTQLSSALSSAAACANPCCSVCFRCSRVGASVVSCVQLHVSSHSIDSIFRRLRHRAARSRQHEQA